uniref:SERPIN domain-containing protein n=1 Tax=Globodera pallida TaxID=36090 RepID=A0A183C482_GLOPA
MQSTSSLALFHHGVSEVQADFALKMLRTSMGRKINSNYSFVISPSCLSIVLAMAHGGAQGETEREIRKLLANDINAAQLHQYTHQLLQNLLYNKQNNQFFSLELVNKIFIKKAYGVKNEYKLFLDTHFGPNHLDLVEFGAYHNLGTMINSLIEYLTKRKVQNFLRPETIGKFTNFLIVNAIYFKAKWAVEMLHSIGTFIYSGTVDFQLLGIPYSGGELFLFILLPRERFGLAQLLAKLTGNLLQNFFCECFETDIYVNMPKFKLETEHYLKEPCDNVLMTGVYRGLDTK